MTYPFDPDWCAFHNRSEPIIEGGYVCGECWHSFGPGELVAEHNALIARWGGTPVSSVDDVYCCPLCAHDL